MKKQDQKQVKKLSLSKETITHLNNLQLLKVIGGDGGGQGQPTDTTISNVSFTHTAPSGGCV